jgi:hypothetical protein
MNPEGGKPSQAEYPEGGQVGGTINIPLLISYFIDNLLSRKQVENQSLEDPALGMISTLMGNLRSPQRVFHGTDKPQRLGLDAGIPKGTHNEWEMLDRLLGTHVAEDALLANKFAEGVYSSPKQNIPGAMYPGHIDTSKFKTVSQTFPNSGYIATDQVAIAEDMLQKVMPYRKDLFVEWMTKARSVDENTAARTFDTLQKGKPLTEEIVGGRHNLLSKSYADLHGLPYNPGTYVANYDSQLNMLGPRRLEVVEQYRKALQDEGYHGLKYINTAPMETQGVSNPTSYIIFNPKQHFYSYLE